VGADEIPRGFGAKILEPLTPLARIREMFCIITNFLTARATPMRSAVSKSRSVRASWPLQTLTTPSPAIERTRRAALLRPLSELERCSNAQFDKKIVEVFVQAMRHQPNPIIEVNSLSSGRSS